MGYTFERDESVRDAAVRVIGEELNAAIGDLADVIEADPPEAVHDCRKRCKRIRAVARLARPALGKQYATVNVLARDAARELSDLRDATALAENLASQSDLFDDSPEAFERARGTMDARRARAEAALSPDLPAVRRAVDHLEHLREFTNTIAFSDDGWDAIGDGLERTYRRGRKALERSERHPSAEHFHEWRKRVKYTRHHLELLSPTAPEILVPLESAMHDLSDLLGDAHDLAVIRDAVPDPVADERLATRQAELEAAATDLGRRLYAESPGRFADRLSTYWSNRA